jgi:hypothetical protein
MKIHLDHQGHFYVVSLLTCGSWGESNGVNRLPDSQVSFRSQCGRSRPTVACLHATHSPCHSSLCSLSRARSSLGTMSRAKCRRFREPRSRNEAGGKRTGRFGCSPSHCRENGPPKCVGNALKGPSRPLACTIPPPPPPMSNRAPISENRRLIKLFV